MCLAVPGKVISIEGESPQLRKGKVDFGGVAREVNLAFVPKVEVGDYVMVHVGFALAQIDETEAYRVFEYIDSLEQGKPLPLDHPHVHHGTGASLEEQVHEIRR
ncbi:MAG: HypC/HybG/HupF family hydrogenase formation chaperone [Candidatus Omnitrophica bacterium]|nr:HypC/HybG/HupF family hydrogenase formation chaperone [Candidatus Omnitrophota bacterium]MCA9431072.1 HypC/HybG/HupF family hydrogenase formation chaperone [Candidatus Omnitrophota bacterium]MCA9434688.1 HypC/HybG/HupF family hydrogenase formation chaperone [Candidatus Omnitrophota bacterium]